MGQRELEESGLNFVNTKHGPEIIHFHTPCALWKQYITDTHINVVDRSRIHHQLCAMMFRTT